METSTEGGAAGGGTAPAGTFEAQRADTDTQAERAATAAGLPSTQPPPRTAPATPNAAAPGPAERTPPGAENGTAPGTGTAAPDGTTAGTRDAATRGTAAGTRDAATHGTAAGTKDGTTPGNGDATPDGTDDATATTTGTEDGTTPRNGDATPVETADRAVGGTADSVADETADPTTARSADPATPGTADRTTPGSADGATAGSAGAVVGGSGDAAAAVGGSGTEWCGGADGGGVGAVSSPGRGAVVPSSLSPSRAGDFMQCPLLYRFRVIDRLPEKPSEAATRGTLVHAVLERLFDAPAAERTAPRAKALIPGQWDRLRESRPELVELFADDSGGERLARWLAEAERLVERWFTLEDPTRLEPADRELFVEAELDSGLRLRGIIDRVDVAPTGEVRIVDYKTGKAPRPEYAEGALFQMKFYALVVWRLKKVVPRRLQLVYLGSGDVLTYDPVVADLERVERKLLALWEAIRLATRTGDWRPRPTKLCGWCDHRAHCPEFGGTPPPYPLPLGGAAPREQGRMGPD